MRRFSLSIGLVVLVLLPAPGLAEVPAGPEGIAFAHPAEAAGNDAALLDAWMRTIEADPDAPASELLLLRVGDLLDRIPEPDGWGERLERLFDREWRNGFVRSTIAGMLAGIRLRGGDVEGADGLLAEGVVDAWHVIGPFGGNGPADLYRSYPPSVEVDLDASYLGVFAPLEAVRNVGWRPVVRGRLDRGVDLYRGVRPAPGSVYAFAQVRIPEGGECLLEADGIPSFRFWWNGRDAGVFEREAAYLPRRIRIPLTARAGWNRIRIQLTNPSTLRIRILHPDGLPIEGIETAPDRSIHPLGEGIDGTGGPRPTGAEAAYREHLADGEVSPYDRLALATLLAAEGLHPEAVAQAESAAEGSDDPAVLFHAARIVHEADYIPAELRRSRTRRFVDRAIQADDPFVPARMLRAELLQEGDQVVRAMREYEAVLETAPGRVPTLWALARMFSRKEWDPEERRILDRLREAAPEDPSVRSQWRSYYDERGNPTAAVAELDAILDRYPLYLGALRQRMEVYRAAGEIDAAFELLDRMVSAWGETPDLVDLRIDLLVRTGRLPEGIDLARDRIESDPLDAALHDRLGNLHLLVGDTEGGLAAFRESLRIDPTDARLRRRVERLEGKDRDFAAPWAPETASLIESAPGPEAFPDAPVCTLLDQEVIRFQADGSFTRITHRIIKVLTEQGREILGQAALSGEPLVVRTIRTDGTVLEPMDLRNNATMPGLEPGAVVEIRTRSDESARSGDFDTGAFLFMDPDGNEPMLLSRLVVILPREIEGSARILEGNLDRLDGKFTHVRRVEEDRVIHVWEARDVPRVEPEPARPPIEEIFPYVRILRSGDWDELAAGAWLRFGGRTRETPELEAALTEAIGEAIGLRERVEAIFGYVNRTVTHEGWGDATATLLQEKGDRFTLFRALLEGAGIAHEPALGRPADPRVPASSLGIPSLNGFGFELVRIPLGEYGILWVQAGARYQPLGLLAPDLSGGTALVLGPEGGRLEPLPEVPLSERGLSMASTFVVAADGGIAGSWTLEIPVLWGYRFKENMIQTDETRRRMLVERFVGGLFPGAALDGVPRFPDLDAFGTPLRIEADFRAPRGLVPEGGGSRCRSGLEPTGMQEKFASKPDREDPFLFGEEFVRTDRVRIRLAGDLRVRRVPRDLLEDGRFGTYSLTWRRDDPPGTWVVERTVRIPAQRIPAADFPAFLDFCTRIDEAEKQGLLVE